MPTARTPVAPLTEIDIVLSVYNQEQIIERILAGVLKNTVTPFTLILVFDGCTDASRERAEQFLKNAPESALRKTIITEASNVYETRANNIGFKLAQAEYLITLQDDMEIMEPGWDVRLTFPLRKFDSVLGVSARMALDIVDATRGRLAYTHIAGRERFSLPRNRFAVRDVINRGPIALRTAYLRQLDYLDESYAPSYHDDDDLCLRAWRDAKLVCGAFWIDYVSKPEWSKSKAADSTIESNACAERNAPKIAARHGDYLAAGVKHSENITIEESEIDYPPGFNRAHLSRLLRARRIQFLRAYIGFHWNRYKSVAVRRLKRLAGLATRS